MIYSIEKQFKNLVKYLEEDFGHDIDTHGVLYILGVQILGVGYQKFTKEQKTDLMHIALCTVLEPYGYYKFTGMDEQNWPHFELVKKLPKLAQREQQMLIKEAIIEYITVNDIIDESIIKSGDIV
jgi:hypothetical protein